MTDVTLNPLDTGAALKRAPFASVALNTIVSMNLSGVASAAATFSSGAAGSEVLTGDMDQLHLKTNVANAFSLSGVRFSRAGQDYVVKASGAVQVNPSPVTGNGTTVGTMTPAQGEVLLDSWTAGGSPAVSNWRGVAGAPVNGPDTPFSTYAITFRVPTAPLRTGSVSILGTMQDGTTFNVTADSDGYINATRIKGKVNYTTGVVIIVGVTPTAAGGQTKADLSFLGVPGVTNAYVDLVRQETVRLNAVAFTYLPLDAALLGIDPVRLPTDGRVPIFRPGGAHVIGHKDTTTPATAIVGGTLNCGRTRLSRVRVIGNDGATQHTGYTVDLEAGVVTWTDVTGFVQPMRVEHRVEDMTQTRDAQINGQLTGMRPLTHAYPVGSYISSALIAGDLAARVPLLFDQATWNPRTFTDSLVGDASTATYNDIDYPVEVTNAGAVTERWALLFKTTLTFDIIGEHLGVIGEGSINTETAPLNNNAGAPYFRIAVAGWGGGWSVGNVVRINTVGALPTFWLAQTITPGAEAGDDYSFEVLVRGDVDNPIA
jgi:hypothetical protein